MEIQGVTALSVQHYLWGIKTRKLQFCGRALWLRTGLGRLLQLVQLRHQTLFKGTEL